MLPVTEAAIRASFVNCSKGEANRLPVPSDLTDRPWADLDFLGWSDPSAPGRAYLVAESAPGLVGVVLRVAAPTGQQRRSACSLCLTAHTGDGVSLMTARKAGPAGRQGDSVGTYICTDLACSLYLRGKKEALWRVTETIPLETKINRTMATLTGFLRKIAA